MNSFPEDCNDPDMGHSYSWFTFEPSCKPLTETTGSYNRTLVARNGRIGSSEVTFVAEKIILTMSDWYNDAWWDLRDKRVDKWPMLGSPLPTVLLTAAYALFAFYLGPRLMKDRKPFDLRLPIICYNACMIAFNGYICHQLWVLAWGNSYNWFCEPLDRSLNPQSLQIAFTMWLYFVSKFLDWLDTMFFILRKKFDHLSGLHLYHHTVMPSCAWFCARFNPGGQPTTVGLFNCFVHVFMHSYYFVSALGPRYRKYLWWKKYLTILQMLQFAVGIGHALQALMFQDCGIHLPREWGFASCFHPIIFFYLFIKFYKKTYWKR